MNSIDGLTGFEEVPGKIFRCGEDHVGESAGVGLGKHGNDVFFKLGVRDEEAQAGAGAWNHANASHDLMNIFGHEGDAAELLAAELVEFSGNAHFVIGRPGIAKGFSPSAGSA